MTAPSELVEPTLSQELEESARRLESLGNPTRLAVFRLLVKAGPVGLPVGEIQRRLGIPASTLSHHLSHLVQNELVLQEREGRVLRCRPNFARMTALLEFLTEECCGEAGAPCGKGGC